MQISPSVPGGRSTEVAVVFRGIDPHVHVQRPAQLAHAGATSAIGRSSVEGVGSFRIQESSSGLPKVAVDSIIPSVFSESLELARSSYRHSGPPVSRGRLDVQQVPGAAEWRRRRCFPSAPRPACARTLPTLVSGERSSYSPFIPSGIHHPFAVMTRGLIRSPV